jgi:hypothetical protein
MLFAPLEGSSCIHLGKSDQIMSALVRFEPPQQTSLPLLEHPIAVTANGDGVAVEEQAIKKRG